MATKKTQDLLKECDTQIDSLLTSFGRLLYENIQAGVISYYFDPASAALRARAKRLIRDIVTQKISEKKSTLRLSRSNAQGMLREGAESVEIPKPAPQVTSRRTAPIKVPAKVPTTKVAVKPSLVRTRSKTKKNKMMAVLQGVKNVFLGELTGSGTPPPTRSDRPRTVTEENGQGSLGIERRGQLEPYTRLVVDLHVIANKLLDVQNDINDCISAGLLHTSSDKTAVYQAAVDQKIQMIISLIRMKEEVIKRIMDEKKQFFAESAENTPWKAEEDFLKQAEQDMLQTTQRIDVLIDKVVGLFENIKEVYQKDLDEGRLAREKETGSPSEDFLESPSPDELPVEEDLEEPTVEEPSGEENEEFTTPEQETEERTRDLDDDGLFETASRKLSSEIAGPEEKLDVLHILFRNASKKTVTFLYEFIKNADVFVQKQVTSLLSQLDYPAMIDLYRRLITDENSSLRLQGIMGLVKLGSEEAKHVITSAVHDHDAHVRRFIVNYLEHLGGEPEATAIARLANDSDEHVARIAIRKLGLMANHFAFVNLVPKLETTNMKIRKEAILMLKAMVGTDLGYNYASSDSECKIHAQPWKDLAKKSYTHPRLLRDLRLEHAQKNKVSLPKTQTSSRSVVRDRGSKRTISRSRNVKRS